MPSRKSERKQLRKQATSNWRPSPEREAREREHFERTLDRESLTWRFEVIDASDQLLKKLRTFCERAGGFPELSQMAMSLQTLISPGPDEEWPMFLTGHWRELILDACQDEAMREEANVILRELAAFNGKYLTGEARP